MAVLPFLFSPPLLSSANAANPTSPNDPDTVAKNADNVPDPPEDPTRPTKIDVRKYTVSVAKRQDQGKTQYYFFNDSTDARPFVGRILLLRKEKDPVMAFRVLRTYPDRKQFLARRVRAYGSHQALNENETYDAYEKAAEYVGPPRPLPGDPSDLPESAEDSEPPEAPDETTSEADAMAGDAVAAAAAPETEDNTEDNTGDETEDDSTNAEPSESTDAPEEQSENQEVKTAPQKDESQAEPPSPDDNDSNLEQKEEDTEEDLDISTEETPRLDQFDNVFSVLFGYLRNSTSGGGSGYYSGGGIRYGFTLSYEPFISKRTIQDSLVAEGGLFMYKVILPTSDSFSVLPISATLRYNLHFASGFGLFLYGGLLANRVTSATDGGDRASTEPTFTENRSALNSIVPAIGFGLMFPIGPNWLIRADIGADMIAAGLMLKF